MFALALKRIERQNSLNLYVVDGKFNLELSCSFTKLCKPGRTVECKMKVKEERVKVV